MKLLLDTHIALWAFTDPDKLPEEIVTVLKSSENTVYYSMASVWEIAIKHKIRPDEMPISEEEFVELCSEAGLRQLPISVEHIYMIKTLVRPENSPRHNDPMLDVYARTPEVQPLPSVDEVCKDAKRIAVLENVVNPTNVGAIVRSAAALGMDAILLTSGCSNPLYRRAVRVSMGTIFQIPWTILDAKEWPDQGMDTLRGLGFRTAAMALRDDSLRIDDDRLFSEEKLAVILGTEGDGLADETIAACDYTVRIPMFHGVDSLNVAAASAVTFWELQARS